MTSVTEGTMWSAVPSMKGTSAWSVSRVSINTLTESQDMVKATVGAMVSTALRTAGFCVVFA